MSIYTDISKKIGWTADDEIIPAPEVAGELFKLVVDDHNVAAFEKVFRVFRFASEAKDQDDRDAINIICEAFSLGEQIFNK